MLSLVKIFLFLFTFVKEFDYIIQKTYNDKFRIFTCKKTTIVIIKQDMFFIENNFYFFIYFFEKQIKYQKIIGG